MFVFWYCHKRGRETRLAKEAEVSTTADDDDDDIEVSDSDENEDDNATARNLEATLNQPDPAQVALPPRTDSEQNITK